MEKAKPSRWPLIVAAAAAIGVLMLACSAGGLWLLKQRRTHNPEPAIAEAPAPIPSASHPRSKATEKQPDAIKPPPEPAKTKPVEKKPPEQKQAEKKPAEERHTEKKPAAEKQPAPVSPPPAPKPSPPPPPADPIDDGREVALAHDLPPELELDIVDAVNSQREKAGLQPIYLDAESTRRCQARAEALARHPAQLSAKGVERDGAAVAAEEPLAALAKWLEEPARRALLLQPRLRTFGAGFARNVEGQWSSVFDWTSGIDREPMETTAVTGAIVFPAPGQTRVPLWFPGNEIPDPLPEATDKLAGYPITLMFPPRTSVDSVTAHLTSWDGREVEVWLSSPDKPANPRFANSQQNTICLIAKRPLKPSSRYHVQVAARVSGDMWSAQWDFSTLTEGQIQHEMAGTLLRTLNAHRRKAGLAPVALDGARSKLCTAHARYLAINAPGNPSLNWNEEKPNLPGYSEAAAALAHSASIQGGGGPVEAVTGLVDSLISRPQLLDPRLLSLGVGYTPFVRGGWIWVMDLQRQREPSASIREFLYPAPDQQEVPLMYPPDEIPSPIPPESKDRQAGYAITAEFLYPVKVTKATASLAEDKGEAVPFWLSTPASPAIAGYPQHSICVLPKAPLKPATRYTVTLQAEVDGKPWQRRWSFRTLAEPDRFSGDLEEQVLGRVNAVRKAAGLRPVRLDAEMSRGCQLHAHYLALNARNPAAQGMGVHQEDSALPGATPEGAQAAKSAVIAVLLAPQTCIEGWMATLYHRIPLLAPDLERIGFGHARMGGRKWACVLDTNGRSAR